ATSPPAKSPGRRRLASPRRLTADASDRISLHSNQGHDAMTDLSATDIDKEMVTKANAKWAPAYDLVFGAVFEKGRQAAIEAAERIGGRGLGVGVGTGISLPEYSDKNTI